MKKISLGLIVLWMLICSVISAEAQLSIGIGLPNVSIGINLPLFPELVPVPGYPVYYAPQVEGNYFFYDGMYWVYQDDNWYASSWYNGPWSFVEPESVPLFVLRIPVRYYQHPPVYFRGWQANSPPHWGQHWGPGWEQRRSGWDRWKRASAPARAPLPAYQRKYSGDRYPRVEQQHTLRTQSYRYQPRDKAVRQHFKQQTVQKAPAAVQQRKQPEPQVKSQRPQDSQRSMPVQHVAPPESRSQPPPQAPAQQRGPAIRDQRQQPGAAQHEQQAPRPQGQIQKAPDRKEQQEHNQGQGQGQGQKNDDDRGRGRDK